jgi:hypothetical protein
MINALFSLIVAIAGALVYLVCSEGTLKAKFAELGRLAWPCGLIALCFALASKVVHLF